MSDEFDKHQYKMFYEASLKEIIRLIEQRDQAQAKVQKALDILDQANATNSINTILEARQILKGDNNE